MKVKTVGYLRKLIPAFKNIITGQNNVLAQTALITGDINDDNKLIF